MVARHRAATWFSGRRAYLAAAFAVVIGLGVTGVALANARPDSDRPATTVAADEQDRARAAQRADRADRAETASPTTAASASPTTAAEASPSPTATATKRAAAEAAPKKATQAATAKAKPAWVHPMPGATVTSCFGMRWGVLHAGIDLAMPADTPIRAAGAGTVVAAGWAYPGYGISVVVDHGNGFLTHYAHQSRTAVQVGDRVAAGQVIGYEGSTGDSTGPHLHFEVHNGLWNQVDPAPWMRSRGVNLGC